MKQLYISAMLALALSLLPGELVGQVDLGTAGNFSVLAGSGITNTGPTTVVGDIGTSPNPSIVGLASITHTGTVHAADAVALQAQSDLTIAYNTAAGLAATGIAPAGALGGLTLVAGVYGDDGASFNLTGVLTLDAQGDPNATWVFQTGSTLITASGSSVLIINGGQACHVFWQVGSSATLGTFSSLQGNVLALTSITATTGATVLGRLLARNGAVTLDTNTIIEAICAQIVEPPPDGEGDTDEDDGDDAASAEELKKALILAAQSVNLTSLPGMTAVYTLGFAQFDTEVFSLQQRFADIRAVLGLTRPPSVYNPIAVIGDKNPVLGGKNPRGGKNAWSGKSNWGVQPKEVEVSDDPRWGFFITGTGDFATVGDADGTSVGTTLGIDYRVNEHFLIGVSIGYSRMESDFFVNSDIESDGGKAAIYGMYQDGDFFIEGLIGGGYNDYDIERSAFLGVAHGDTSGAQFDSYLGIGYDFRLGNWTITPMASLLYTIVSIDGYHERGSLVPLIIESQDASSLRVRVGPRVAYTTRWGDAYITPSFSAQWQHEFMDDELPMEARFSNEPGDLFTVRGPKFGRDSILLTSAVNVAWKRYAAYIAYQANLGRENYESHTALVGFRVTW